MKYKKSDCITKVLQKWKQRTSCSKCVTQDMLLRHFQPLYGDKATFLGCRRSLQLRCEPSVENYQISSEECRTISARPGKVQTRAGQNKNTAWICGRNTSKTRLWPWKKRWSAWRILTGVGIWFHSVSLPVLVVAMACSIAGAKICKTKMWEGPYWEGVWPCLDPWDVVRLRTSSSYWTDQEKYGPHSELFFFLISSRAGSAVRALRVCGNAPGVCADWFTPSGSRR